VIFIFGNNESIENQTDKVLVMHLKYYYLPYFGGYEGRVSPLLYS
jgi:hypothetical protein